MKSTVRNAMKPEPTTQSHQPGPRLVQHMLRFQQTTSILWLLSRVLGMLIFLGVLFGSPVSAFAHTAEHTTTQTTPPVGTTNVFAYPQCTWWANARYHELHGVYVPWSTHANAWQWPDRARDFGWHVDPSARIGSIIVLQPWKQGAYGLGHVAVVEQLLDNGHVLASNLNWGKHPTTATTVEFAPGPGVSFIDQSTT